jgi:hypothetical protein
MRKHDDLTMCTELGFHITEDPDDRGVKIVTLPVCTEHQWLRFWLKQTNAEIRGYSCCDRSFGESHVVAADQQVGTPQTPAFSTIARNSDFTEATLALFLLNPHPQSRILIYREEKRPI